MKKMFTICMAITLMLCIGGLSAQVERAIITPKEKPLTFVSAVKSVTPIIRGTIFDDVEGHTAFAMNSPGHVPWSYYVGNPNDTWGIQGVTFENVGEPGVTVFKPSATNPAVTYPPKSGLQFFAFFNVANSAGGPTNTWIISPMFTVEGSATISFWARALTAQYGAERFKVLTSSTGSAHTDFTNVISPGNYVATDATNWTEFTYNIPADAKYVAIACVSDDIFALFIDDITISGIGGPAPCDEITNLAAEIQGTDVKLTWTAAPGSPTGYKVYNGSTNLGTTTNTQYVVPNLAIGAHTLGVEAIYADDCEPVKVTTIVNMPAPLNPVKNLSGTCEDGTITLNWDEPEVNGGNSEQWVTHSTLDPRGGIGTSNPVDLRWANRFSPANLAALGITEGSTVTKMKFYFTKYFEGGKEIVAGDYYLKIWQGASSTAAGTEKLSQQIDFNALENQEWNEYTLTTPVAIDPSLELWIGMRTNMTEGDGSPGPIDYGPIVANGNKYSTGGAWSDLGGIGSFNFMVAAFIETSGDVVELSHYDVYRDHVKQGETTVTTFTQTGMTDLYNYCIVAVYENDAQSQKVCKIVSCAPCEAPTNLSVTPSNDCNFATLRWDAPAGPAPAYYNIFRDGVRVATNVTTLVHTTAAVPNVTHEWEVSAVCVGDNESARISIIEGCNSINENAKEGFFMWPNPTAGEVKITAGSNINTIEVISFLGQTVISQPGTGNEVTLDISTLTNGVYFVRVISENGVSVKKLVKK